MAKYHINPMGNVGACTAKKGRCPFGGEEDHYSSKTDAHRAYEAQMTGGLDNAALSKEREEEAARAAQAEREIMDKYFDAPVRIPSKTELIDGAKNLFESFKGSKGYAKTIEDARERAKLANDFFSKGKREKYSIDYGTQTGPASSEVASNAYEALRARRSSSAAKKLDATSEAPAPIANAARAALNARKHRENNFLRGARSLSSM